MKVQYKQNSINILIYQLQKEMGEFSQENVNQFPG